MIIDVFWRPQFRTLLLVNLAGIMEKADEILLVGVYRELGLQMHASPSALGSLTLLRSIVQILCFPLAAYFSLHCTRASVIAVGALAWSLATFGVGISSNFGQVAISRAMNGIGLALVIPAIQSMVADSANEGSRGRAFGWLQFTGLLGTILGTQSSILLAGTTVFGISGWRISFHLIAILSILVGILVYCFAVDPRFTSSKASSWKRGGHEVGAFSWFALRESFADFKRVVQIPTFQAIVAQGVVGSFPAAAFSFIPMWLELTGFSHGETATMIGVLVAAASVGGLFGGHIGDVLSRHLPNTGRIIMAQIGSGLGVPLGAVLLLILPYDPATVVLHAFLLCLLGLSSWCATATNNPVFAEIVPEKSRTTVYALDRSFESLLAAFAPFLVGIFAEDIYGYISPSKGGSATLGIDRENAIALGKALYTATGIPSFVCCAIYTSLYWTYPKDRDKAKAAALMELQMKRISSAEYAVLGTNVEGRNTEEGWEEKCPILSLTES